MKYLSGNYQNLCSWGVLFGILSVILVSPAPLGSNRPYVWFALAAAVYALLILWGIGRLLLGSETTRARRREAWILTILAIWLGLILLQTIDLPAYMVRMLSPFAHSMQQNLALISIGTLSSLSMDAGRSYSELLKYGAYVALFFLVLTTATTSRRLFTVVTVLIIGGLLEALFGLYVSVSDYVIFPELGGSTDQRAGSFVNSGHFGNMLMLVFCLTAGVITGVMNAHPGTSDKSLLGYLFERSWLFAGLCAAALVMLIAAIAAGAWEPVVFAGVAFGIMMILAFGSRQERRGEYLVAPVIIGIAIVVLATAGLKLGMSGLWSEEWIQQNRLGLGMLSEVWLTGVGAGNYEWVFQMFRDDSLRFVTYNHAQNDYLEAAIEQGVPVMLVLGASIGLMLRTLYRGYRVRRNPFMRGIVCGCLAAMMYMMLNALVEFSFRIPANAVYFFVIAAVGLAACRVDRGGTDTGKSKSEAV